MLQMKASGGLSLLCCREHGYKLFVMSVRNIFDKTSRNQVIRGAQDKKTATFDELVYFSSGGIWGFSKRVFFASAE